MLARGIALVRSQQAAEHPRIAERPAPDEVLAELEWVIACAEDHLGVERAGRYLRKFYPWYAERLGLTRREREPLVRAPTTAHARELWNGFLGAARPLAA